MSTLSFIKSNPWLHQLLAFVYRLTTADGDDIRWISQRPLINGLLEGEPEGLRLDCGCGLGMYQRKIRQGASPVMAMDIQESNLRYCLREGLITNTAIRGDTSFLPFVPDTFDTVLCSEVIEHIVDDQQAVKELARVLKPGGRLIISVPVPPGNIDLDEYGHKREGYTPEGLRILLKDQGLKVQTVDFCFFSWSRRVMQALAWHVRYLKINPSRLILIPVWLERFLGIKSSPHDMVVLAVKEGR